MVIMFYLHSFSIFKSITLIKPFSVFKPLNENNYYTSSRFSLFNYNIRILEYKYLCFNYKISNLKDYS